MFFNSRLSVEYIDGATKLFVGAEVLTPRMTIALYPDYITVGSPTGPRLADETLRQAALERVHKAAQFLGWTIE